MGSRLSDQVLLSRIRSVKPVANADARFETAIRAGVRGLWNGALTFEQARNQLGRAVITGFTRAFHAGLEDVGIMPSEMTVEETEALNAMISQSISRIEQFLRDVDERDRASGAKLGPHLSRADIWINRYDEVQNLARQMAGEDEKLKWVVDPFKEHCVDCLKLDGKVKRASQWRDYGIRPRAQSLACGGWRCGCELVPTDDPLSKGPLPSITGATLL